MLKQIRHLAIRLAGIHRLEDHYDLPSLLGPSSVVVDGGCNFGRFAHGLIQMHGCQVLGVEPESNNLQQIKEHAKLKLFRGALSDYDGEATLRIGEELGQD